MPLTSESRPFHILAGMSGAWFTGPGGYIPPACNALIIKEIIAMPLRDDPAVMTRLFYLALFAVCAGLPGFGLYLEHVKNLEPCPLCVNV